MTESIAQRVEILRLDNGLRILVLRRDFAPTFAGYYHFAVGAAHDPKGRSGIAHLLEHMMFKGTRRLGAVEPDKEEPLLRSLARAWERLEEEEDRRGGGDPATLAALRAEIDDLTRRHRALVVPNEYAELLSRAGGTGMNATTSYDLTRYYVQLPADQLELWFRLEAERLRNPVFREFHAERDVVLEERRLRIDNQAEGLGFEAHRRILFAAHPYGEPVIGWPDDIRRLRQSDAEDYFRTWYSPSNCLMALVGDVQVDQVRRLAEEHLGDWARQDLPPRRLTAEPPSLGPRRQVVHFQAQPHLRLGWVTVPEGHPDHFALELLSGVLGGLASSRLNRVLVHEKGVAASAVSFAFGQLDGGSFNVVARPRDDHDLAELEEAVLTEIARLADEGCDEEELQRARVHDEGERVRRLAGNLTLAMDLAAATVVGGDPSWLDDYGRRLDAVTVDDLKRVARAYLDPRARAVVEVRPPESAPVAPAPVAAAPAAGASTEHGHQAPPRPRGALHSHGFAELLALVDGAPGVHFHIPTVGQDVQRRQLDCGAVLFLKRDAALPALHCNGVFLGGAHTAPVEEQAPYALAGSLWSEGGGAGLGPDELERRKEDLGLRLMLRPSPTAFSLQLWSLSRHLDEALDLVAGMLRRPGLDERRLEVLKGRHAEIMRRRADYPAWAASLLAQHVVHGDHPLLGYQPGREEMQALTPEDVGRTLRRHLGPSNLYLTAVGEMDPEALADRWEELLAGWPRAGDPRREWLPRPTRNPGGVHLVEREIPQPAVRLVQELAVDRESADEREHAALEVLNRLLGGSGFRSRLMEKLRTEEGLTYGVSSSLAHEGRGGVPGQLTIAYQTRAEAVARSVDLVRAEIERLRTEVCSEQEVQEQIQAWRNAFLFRFENEAAAVTRLMQQEVDERPFDRDQRVLAEVERVRPEDVKAAARHLDPEALTVAVWGSATPEQREALARGARLRIWERDEVLRGGF